MTEIPLHYTESRILKVRLKFLIGCDYYYLTWIFHIEAIKDRLYSILPRCNQEISVA